MELSSDHKACGVGIGFRRSLAAAICDTRPDLDFVEVTPENFLRRGGRFSRALDEAAEIWPILAHGVSFSLGGPDPFDHEQIALLKTFLDRYQIESFSDHLCFSRSNSAFHYDLIPVPFTDECVKHCASRIRELSDALERPVYVENISAYTIVADNGWDEGRFTRAVCDEANCGILLDVNNVYVNSCNHQLDAFELLDSLPISRAKQIHVAGHTDKESGLKIDTHRGEVRPAVWKLLERALRTTGKIPVLLEWDTEIPTLDEVMVEANKARRVYEGVFMPPSQTPSDDEVRA